MRLANSGCRLVLVSAHGVRALEVHDTNESRFNSAPSSFATRGSTSRRAPANLKRLGEQFSATELGSSTSAQVSGRDRVEQPRACCGIGL